MPLRDVMKPSRQPRRSSRDLDDPGSHIAWRLIALLIFGGDVSGAFVFAICVGRDRRDVIAPSMLAKNVGLDPLAFEARLVQPDAKPGQPIWGNVDA